MKLMNYISTAGVQDSITGIDAGKSIFMIIISVILLSILILIKVYSIKKI